MYKYQVHAPCEGAHDKRRVYAAVRMASGVVEDHKIDFRHSPPRLTVYVTVEPENDEIFKYDLQAHLPHATITAPQRGKQ